MADGSRQLYRYRQFGRIVWSYTDELICVINKRHTFAETVVQIKLPPRPPTELKSPRAYVHQTITYPSTHKHTHIHTYTHIVQWTVGNFNNTVRWVEGLNIINILPACHAITTSLPKRSFTLYIIYMSIYTLYN